MEAEGRECECPYIAEVLEKRRKKWLGQKDLAAFFETMRTNSAFSRYTYRHDFRKEGTH